MSEPSTTNLLRAEARLRGQNPAQKTAACGRRTPQLYILLRMAGTRNDFYRRKIRFRRIVNTTDSTIDVPSGMYTRVLPLPKVKSPGSRGITPLPARTNTSPSTTSATPATRRNFPMPDRSTTPLYPADPRGRDRFRRAREKSRALARDGRTP